MLLNFNTFGSRIPPQLILKLPDLGLRLRYDSRRKLTHSTFGVDEIPIREACAVKTDRLSSQVLRFVLLRDSLFQTRVLFELRFEQVLDYDQTGLGGAAQVAMLLKVGTVFPQEFVYILSSNTE
jgi:hypothetical protein